MPAEGVVGEARDHRAEHLPGDDREQHPADHHLALAHVVGVAEAGEDERNQAAGEDAGADPRRHQEAEVGRERAEQQHDGEAGDADLDAARLAEAVADRAEERLRQRVGQGVGGVEQCRDLRRDREVRRDRQDDRIGETQREAARECAGGEDEEDRHGCCRPR